MYIYVVNIFENYNIYTSKILNSYIYIYIYITIYKLKCHYYTEQSSGANRETVFSYLASRAEHDM